MVVDGKKPHRNPRGPPSPTCVEPPAGGRECRGYGASHLFYNLRVSRSEKDLLDFSRLRHPPVFVSIDIPAFIRPLWPINLAANVPMKIAWLIV